MPEPARDANLSVSDLAGQSGLPVSTIRYYVREGLLPPGQWLSRTRVRYSGEHLRAIEQIKALREAGVALTAIRPSTDSHAETRQDSAVVLARRDDVVEAATDCFLSAGYAGTSPGAIARAASMSKSTLYQYFSSKDEIFMACAERVVRRLYADVWPVIRQAGTADERLRVRWEAFVRSFGEWAPIMDLVRGLAVGSPAFRAEYLRLTETITAPIARELSMLDGGRRGDLDSEFASYVVMGMAEAAARAVYQGRDDSGDAWRYLASVLAELARGGPANTRTDAR